MSTWPTWTESESWTESSSDKWQIGTQVECSAKLELIVAESEFAGAAFFWEMPKEGSSNVGFSTESIPRARPDFAIIGFQGGANVWYNARMSWW
ncbi:hypothetical protein SLS62_003330 [Diatrype stigma]|uniref:Uncharacterized protein n=1 Tax=Diatrype stigma TaxID=117547 RepID=A0AAN9UT43_9PEZI